ncbi:Asp23/Gls24 family envelope stress response protein [Streptomyces sp. NPDC059382]|uniref:Asp23/Gls24 family envelope stress response protein n=1 Tax=Streptomyces sp. NPDC059382 TaxID=3346816 RepID=UPI00368FA38A
MAMSANRDPDEERAAVHASPVGDPHEGGPKDPDPDPDEFVEDEPAEGELLPCGRDLAELWEEPRSGADRAHTSVCPHCTAALDDLARLRQAVRTDPPDGSDPGGSGVDASGLIERIMGVVRLELRPGRTLALGEPDEDGWIFEAVAAKVLRAAADGVPGVRSGSCRVGPEAGGRGAARGPVHVEIEVSVGVTRAAREVAELVRERVREAADAALGLEVTAVHVRVADLHEEPAREDGS